MTDRDSQRLLVAFHATVFLSAYWLIHADLPLSTNVSYCITWGLYGAFIGQISLVAIWSAMSNSPLLVRSFGIALLVPSLAAIYSNLAFDRPHAGWWTIDPYNTADRFIGWITALGTLSIVIFVCLSAIRLVVLWVLSVGRSEQTRSGSIRFSIRSILAWTAYFAVLCGVLNCFAAHHWSAFISHLAAGPYLPPLVFAMSAAFSALALLSSISLRFTLPLPLLLSFALSYVDWRFLPAWIHDDIGQQVPISVYLSAHLSAGMLTWTSLLWCRHVGYRIAWRSTAFHVA